MHSKHWPTQPNSTWINLLPSSICSFPLANSMLCTCISRTQRRCCYFVWSRGRGINLFVIMKKWGTKWWSVNKLLPWCILWTEIWFHQYFVLLILGLRVTVLLCTWRRATHHIILWVKTLKINQFYLNII